MWTPSEVRKLVALVAGILAFAAGIYLLITQVKAEGKINITSNIMSGEIESGSAGLLLCFLALALIVVSILGGSPIHTYTPGSGGQPPALNNDVQPKLNDYLRRSYFRRFLVAIIIGWIIFIVFIITTYLMPSNQEALVNLFLTASVFWGIVMFVATISFGYSYVVDSEYNNNGVKASRKE
jgi:nitric oxide reductase large subunit